MIEIPAWPVDRIVDLTGAGDLYASGFLYGYTHGREFATCGRIAALAAGEIISHIGARPETPLAELVAQQACNRHARISAAIRFGNAADTRLIRRVFDFADSTARSSHERRALLLK